MIYDTIYSVLHTKYSVLHSSRPSMEGRTSSVGCLHRQTTSPQNTLTQCSIASPHLAGEDSSSVLVGGAVHSHERTNRINISIRTCFSDDIRNRHVARLYRASKQISSPGIFSKDHLVESCCAACWQTRVELSILLACTLRVP